MNNSNDFKFVEHIDVLLINPPVSNRKMPQDEVVIKYFNTLENAGKHLLGDSDVEPNYGLLSIAANILKHLPDITVKVLDLNILDKQFRKNENRAITDKDIEIELNKYKSQVSGISFMTSSYGEWGHELIRFTKARSDFLFLGGIHPTVRYIDVFKKNEEFINGIVVGEGEIVFIEILRQIFDKEKFGNRYLYTGGGQLIERAILNNRQLSELAIPAYDLMYKENEAIIPRLYTTRGCNFKCSICSVGDFYKTKKTSEPTDIETDKILDDIKEINKKYIIGHYVIGDLCSYGNIQRFSKFLKRLHKLQTNENLQNRAWWCQTRGDVITKELAFWLRETGFRQVGIGCEGATQKQLNSIDKNEKIKNIEKALTIMRKYNIDTQCYWILGLPGETKESIKETQKKILKYLKDGLTTIPHITILVPYPNTAVVKNSEIRVLHEDFSKYWMNCDLYGYGKPVYDTIEQNTQRVLLSSDYIYNIWLETLHKVTEYFEEVSL